MAKLKHQFSESSPDLVDIVSKCLHNVSDLRPSSQKLLKMFQKVKNEMEDIPGESIAKVLDMANIITIREMKTLEKKVLDLQVSIYFCRPFQV